MGARAPSALLNILSGIQMVCGLLLAAGAIYLHIEVTNVTSLRNPNYTMLDFNVYWPQALPWLFVIVSALLLCVSCCAVAGATGKSKFMVRTFIIFQVIVISMLIISAAMALIFGRSDASNEFIKKTIHDVFEEIKTDDYVKQAYENFETKYHCCGSTNSKSYNKIYKDPVILPKSCCGGVDTCSLSDEKSWKMNGCLDVALVLNGIAMKSLSGASVFTAVIGLLNLLVAVILLRRLSSKPKLSQQYQESESKKVLL